MRQAGSLRLSLILPVGSPQALLAAAQVVFFLLRYVGRTELDLVRPPPRPAETTRSIVPGGVLFAAATTSLSPDGAPARDRFERIVRGQIERQYARQGIAPVAYELELL